MPKDISKKSAVPAVGKKKTGTPATGKGSPASVKQDTPKKAAKMSSGGDSVGQLEEICENAEGAELVECSICSRKFATDRIERHTEICEKNSGKEREAFDIKEQRLGGTEAAEYQDVESELKVEKGDWKKTHSEILNAIKAAKKARPQSARSQPDVEFCN